MGSAAGAVPIENRESLISRDIDFAVGYDRDEIGIASIGSASGVGGIAILCSLRHQPYPCKGVNLTSPSRERSSTSLDFHGG